MISWRNIVFNDEQYLQVQRTAMGTRMAPSYANLFMAKLEQDLLARTTTRPLLWMRFIDDIFAVWKDGQESLEVFLHEINTYHPTIKFTAEQSTDRVSFLDTTVILEGDTLVTDLYTKPTDTHHINTSHQRAATHGTVLPPSLTARVSG